MLAQRKIDINKHRRHPPALLIFLPATISRMVFFNKIMLLKHVCERAKSREWTRQMNYRFFRVIPFMGTSFVFWEVFIVIILWQWKRGNGLKVGWVRTVRVVHRLDGFAVVGVEELWRVDVEVNKSLFWAKRRGKWQLMEFYDSTILNFHECERSFEAYVGRFSAADLFLVIAEPLL